MGSTRWFFLHHWHKQMLPRTVVDNGANFYQVKWNIAKDSIENKSWKIYCQTTPTTHTRPTIQQQRFICVCSLRMRNDGTQQCLEITWHVLSVGSVTAPMDWLDSDHVMCFCKPVCVPLLYKWAEFLSGRSIAVSVRSTEEYKKSVLRRR
jgi:hypothetical protein